MERKVTLDGIEIEQYLERRPENYGYVIVTRIKAPDGTYHVDRAFHGLGISQDENGNIIEPTQEEIDVSDAKTLAAFEGMTDEQVLEKAKKALGIKD